MGIRPYTKPVISKHRLKLQGRSTRARTVKAVDRANEPKARFYEFGTLKIPALRFMLPAAHSLLANPAIRKQRAPSKGCRLISLTRLTTLTPCGVRSLRWAQRLLFPTAPACGRSRRTYTARNLSRWRVMTCRRMDRACGEAGEGGPRRKKNKEAPLTDL